MTLYLLLFYCSGQCGTYAQQPQPAYIFTSGADCYTAAMKASEHVDDGFAIGECNRFTCSGKEINPRDIHAECKRFGVKTGTQP